MAVTVLFVACNDGDAPPPFDLSAQVTDGAVDMKGTD
jgi:hypothetical protein